MYLAEAIFADLVSTFWLIGYGLILWFYPVQILKILHTKSVESFSSGGLWCLCLGAWLLEMYLLYYGNIQLQIGNGLAVVFSTTLLILYYKYQKVEFKPPF